MIKIEGEEVIEDKDEPTSYPAVKKSDPEVGSVFVDNEDDASLFYTDDNGEDHCMEFECHSRERTEDGMLYHVTPLHEIGDLDYDGHTVKINGVNRVCDKFEVDDDGKLTILVK